MRATFFLFYATFGTILAILLTSGLKGPDPYYVANTYKIEQGGSSSSYDPNEAFAYQAHLDEINSPVITFFGMMLIDKRTPSMWQPGRKLYDEVLVTLDILRVATFVCGYVIVFCVLLAMRWFNIKFQLIRPRN